MDVVVLAAGMGSRFGGPKQLVAVGPDGEVITDVLLQRAAAAGFDRAVMVVRAALFDEMRSHFATRRPAVATEVVVQATGAGRGLPLGTAHAVAAAGAIVQEAFAVVNADDLYPTAAFALLADHLRSGAVSEHAVVAFPAAETLAGSRPVSRAIVEIGADGRLVAIHEAAVTLEGDTPWADVEGERIALPLDAPVSMNMFGFRPSILDALVRAVDAHVRGGLVGELRLPDVVDAQVRSGADVRVLRCNARCIGLTYREDVPAIRAALA